MTHLLLGIIPLHGGRPEGQSQMHSYVDQSLSACAAGAPAAAPVATTQMWRLGRFCHAAQAHIKKDASACHSRNKKAIRWSLDEMMKVMMGPQPKKARHNDVSEIGPKDKNPMSEHAMTAWIDAVSSMMGSAIGCMCDACRHTQNAMHLSSGLCVKQPEHLAKCIGESVRISAPSQNP